MKKALIIILIGLVGIIEIGSAFFFAQEVYERVQENDGNVQSICPVSSIKNKQS